MITASQTSRGFTLLELMAAMSLMVVAAACLYSSLSTAFHAKQIAERSLRPLESAQAAMEMMMQDLRGATEPNTSLAGDFVGIDDRSGTNIQTDSVSFTSTNHQIGGDTARMTCGIGLIELILVEPKQRFSSTAVKSPETFNLVRRVTDNVLTEDTTEPVEEILCRRVRSLNLRYYDGELWQDQWDSLDLMDTLPVAVEVTLEIEPRPEDLPQGVSPDNRMAPDYLLSVTRLTQVFTLPCGVPLADVEAAALETETDTAAASGGAR